MRPWLGLPARCRGEFAGEATERDALFEQLAHRTPSIRSQLGHADALIAHPQLSLPIGAGHRLGWPGLAHQRKRYAVTRLVHRNDGITAPNRSEEHTSELQSLRQ